MRRFLIIAVLLSSCVGPAGEDGRDGSDSSGMRISVTRRCYLDIDHLARKFAFHPFQDGTQRQYLAGFQRLPGAVMVALVVRHADTAAEGQQQ